MIFAATMMLIIGVFQIFIGIAAIAQSQLVIVGENFAYNVNTTPWGWVHLVIGVIAALAGLALFTGRTWAKAVAIALAGISAIANFFFLVYYPIWSLVIIALDVFVIWAIASARSETAYEGYATSSAGRGAMSDPRATDERWPAENPSAGRHWAPDTKEEATRMGQQTQGMTGEARDRATSSARGGMQNPTQQPPQNPPAS
jgi:hypothetical protein